MHSKIEPVQYTRPSPVPTNLVTLHLCNFEGGSALSHFRAQQLLPRLQAISKNIHAIAARYVHLAAFDQQPSTELQQKMAKLLDYGER